MSFGLLNGLMLLGLAAVALPVIVHLISKRKFDVVQWGAMQFLELGRRTRRRIRIEELLLMLLRIGMLAVLVFALARPWAQGGWLSSFSSSTKRDVVFVIDGSYSMGWEGKAVTPHAAAIQWAHELLAGFRGGDTVALLDARDAVRTVIDSPTSDFATVREKLDELPDPSGSSDLAAASTEAVKILSRTTNLTRHVIVLTDGQSLPWQPGNEAAWIRLDDLRTEPSVKPQIWVVDVAGRDTRNLDNFSVDRIELSREMTVPDFPIRIRTSVHQSGGVATRRRVSLEVNGQRLDEKTLQINVPANGSTPVEFEHRFPTVGSYVVSVVLDPDNLPGDNRADAAVVVQDGVPVLLVDGDPQLDPVQSETFFVKAGLTPLGNRSPWVSARVVDHRDFDAADLEGRSVVFLCNVPDIDEAQQAALEDFVGHGGGLVFAPGDRVNQASYNSMHNAAEGLLPLKLVETDTEEAHTLRPINVDSESLQALWLSGFRTESGIDFVRSRFATWWRLDATAAPPAPDGESAIEGATGVDALSGLREYGPPVIQARLETGDPLVVARQYGAGMIVQLAVPLDADWSTLPSRNDFVPFLHELVFRLAGQSSGRNVEIGMPLQLEITSEETAQQWSFTGPGDRHYDARPAGDDQRPLAELPRTDLAGVYRAHPQGDENREEFFVVNFDRSESDLAPLEQLDRQQLAGEDRITFVDTVDEFMEATRGEASRTELWWLLMLAVLGILVFEVVMTRRLVQGGHESLEAQPPPNPSNSATTTRQTT
ncbi:MAG: VWA domain-containing protein [Planctomycetota bacterium]|nr:MAG: VWA domain-containing protein [Planctomycetota bacterium]REK30032.1 MAG: VWA domain-containing protein [Planctomycetota bacterium]REK37726.1 MAG: VWA domain-containing protein [Planctomycetota bacterium]